MNKLILLTNDDGINSIGLEILSKEIRKIGQVIIIAPDREVSGSGHSLTLRNILRFKKINEKTYSVEGNPVDCVNLAIWYLLEKKPDLIISGINDGWNVAEDALYSGTVAAAMEGAIHYIPSIAISCQNGEKAQLQAAAVIAKKFAELLLEKEIPTRTFFSINVPAKPIKGIKYTVLGSKKHKNIVIRNTDPRGEEYYWLARAKPEYEGDENSDVYALKEGYVSITPLKIDITNYEALEIIRDWEVEG